ncbi:hypothetical protein LZZ85_00720 [Terrimonas sp. NA20]|uniref:Uncharacterized protein n=1 Tax=Terrimonas ginsenosidimutans TaxID=2908004 RepID=A0ABS9KKD0_9BACT|nr:hypothetical protein [Terrimonas ginsenosidimutans]MCG2612773.1 hypothetical protein [Terrimonas ginsenosidimutans]
MSRKNNFDTTFLNRLKKLPSLDSLDLHRWADYIELRCFFNPDETFSRDEFLDCIKDYDDFFITKNSTVDYTTHLVNDEYDDEEVNHSVLNDRAYRSDMRQRFAEDCFRILESRVHIFKNYPFTISSNKRVLYRNKHLNIKNKYYAFLLFTSSLDYIGNHQDLFISSFDIFCLLVLKTLLPTRAEAHLFKPSSASISNNIFEGKQEDRLEQLSKHLHETLINEGKKGNLKKKKNVNSVDLIAWVSNGDSQNHLLSYTGQIFYALDWVDQNYLNRAKSLLSIIRISVPPVNLTFIPFSFRNCEGHWQRETDIGECVLLDRQRLLYHFQHNKSFFTSLPCYDVLEYLSKVKDKVYN